MADWLSGSADAPTLTITHWSTVSQICHDSSALTLSILNKLSWNVITACFEEKTRSVSSEATEHQQQLRPQIPSLDVIWTLQTHWHQNTIWTFHFRRSLRDLQEGKGGHCDLFNVLICLSSLSWPYYCLSSEANTWKHWPAGPQYWFIRWSPAVLKSLSQHTQDTINGDLSVCMPVCVCVRMDTNTFLWPFQSFKANGVNKGTNGLFLGTLSKLVLPGKWTQGTDGKVVHPKVDGGLPCHWRTLKQEVLFFRCADSVRGCSPWPDISRNVN